METVLWTLNNSPLGCNRSTRFNSVCGRLPGKTMESLNSRPELVTPEFSSEFITILDGFRNGVDKG